MYRVTKFLFPEMFRFAASLTKIYEFFMMPKPPHARLSSNMQTMNPECQSWPQPPGVAAFQLHKEPKLKLSLETRNRGDVMIVHCHGRIVYRDEAAALSRLVGEVLEHSRKLILDLSGVTSMDSAGIGELALLQNCAQGKSATFKCAGPNEFVRNLLDLTNLDSVLEIHSSVNDALESFAGDEVCADS